MAQKKEFGEGPIFTIANYVFWFLMGSIYFNICNILFFFVLYTILNMPKEQISLSILPILIISLIPAGPAITALLSAMGKVVREKDVNITRDYFRAYKQNFKQSLLLWVMELAIFSIILVDINFFNNKPYGFLAVPFLYALATVAFIMGIYIFPILSRFYLRTKDVLRLSFYYAVSKLKVTFMNLCVLIAGAVLMSVLPISITILFTAACVAFAIMYFEKDVLKGLEEKLNKIDK